MGFHLDTTGNVWLGSGSEGDTLSDAISAGPPNFYITSAGSIFAQTGTIGGWTINSTELSSGNISIDSTGSITGDYTSGSAGWSINSDGTAEFNNVTVRGTLDGPSLTGELLGSNTSSVRVGNTSSGYSKMSFDSIGGGKFELFKGTSMVLQTLHDGVDTMLMQSGLNTKLALQGGSGDIFMYADTIYLQDSPVPTNSPILYLYDGSSYVRGNNQVLGTDSSGNLEWTTVASSPVTSISGSGEITVTESSGAYTIEHADSDHNTSFASLTSYISHVGSTSAHSYSPISINGLTMQHGYGIDIIGSGDISVSAYNSGGYKVEISHDDSDHSYSSSNVSVSAGSVTSNAGYFLRTLSASNNVITYNRSDFGSDLKINGQRPTSNNGSSVGLSATQYNEVHARYGYFDFITGGNVSSQEIKTDITDLDLGLDFINALAPKKYKYKPELKEDDGKYGFGFIAEEIETLLNNEGENNSKLHQDGHTDYPNYGRCVHELICVCEDEDCCSPPTETYNADTGEHTSTEGCMFDAKCTESCCTDIAGVTIDGINYIHATEAECEEVYIDGRKYASILKDELVAPLVKAVQELSTQISDLTARVEALEG